LYEDPRVTSVSFAQQKLTFKRLKKTCAMATGTVEIQDVTGTLQIYHRSTEVFGNKTNFDTLRPISVKMTKRQILLRNIA
jgi:outer membrane protein assembly factor BamE (lipoprotein component of BamABCDE complex)